MAIGVLLLNCIVLRYQLACRKKINYKFGFSNERLFISLYRNELKFTFVRCMGPKTHTKYFTRIRYATIMVNSSSARTIKDDGLNLNINTFIQFMQFYLHKCFFENNSIK